MNTNPMLDYHLMDVIEDFDTKMLNLKLKYHKINKTISESMVQAEKLKGKTEAKLVEVSFKEFLKKCDKQGCEAIYRKFKKQGLNITEESIVSMYNQLKEVKNNTGKSYDHYIFFD